MTPEPIELVRELREAVGLFAGAMPISPKQAWEEALTEVRRVRALASRGLCWKCEERARGWDA